MNFQELVLYRDCGVVNLFLCNTITIREILFQANICKGYVIPHSKVQMLRQLASPIQRHRTDIQKVRHLMRFDIKRYKSAKTCL